MKPSERITQIALERKLKILQSNKTPDEVGCELNAIQQYLDEEYEKLENKTFTIDEINEAHIKHHKNMMKTDNRKTLEEVLAVVTSLKDTSFGQMEDAKRRNEGYLFGLLDATNAIKQLYNQ